MLINNILNIFWNKDEKRLRMFWRLSLTLLVFSITSSLIVVPIMVIQMLIQGGDPIQALDTSRMPGFLYMLAIFLSAIITFLIAGFLFDRRLFNDFGFHFNKSWFKDLFFGLFLGAFLMLLIFLIEYALGWLKIEDVAYTYTGRPFLTDLIIALTAYTFVGIYEEIMFRGYALKNLAEGLNFKPENPVIAVFLAVFLSSAVFGAAHIINPNSSLTSTINLILAGLFLSLGYLLTGELGISIGLHLTWNFFQGNIFGFAVSGVKSSVNLFHITQKGPDFFTGGDFGPEAGFLGIFALTIGCGLILLRHYLINRSLKLHKGIPVYNPRSPRKKQDNISESDM